MSVGKQEVERQIAAVKEHIRSERQYVDEKMDEIISFISLESNNIQTAVDSIKTAVNNIGTEEYIYFILNQPTTN